MDKAELIEYALYAVPATLLVFSLLAGLRVHALRLPYSIALLVPIALAVFMMKMQGEDTDIPWEKWYGVFCLAASVLSWTMVSKKFNAGIVPILLVTLLNLLLKGYETYTSAALIIMSAILAVYAWKRAIDAGSGGIRRLSP